MTTFDEREKGFEAKFQRDQELQFRVKARRNMLLGLWAAGQMGLTGAAAEAYAKDVVAAEFHKAGDDDVVDKVVADLTAKGVKADDARVRKEMNALFATAKDQIAKQL